MRITRKYVTPRKWIKVHTPRVEGVNDDMSVVGLTYEVVLG